MCVNLKRNQLAVQLYLENIKTGFFSHPVLTHFSLFTDPFMMSLNVVLLTLACSAMLGTTLADWHRSQYPNPQDTSQDFCGRKGQKSYVCDPDQKLTFTQGKSQENIRR